MSDEILTPKFTKKQIVRISLYDHKGKAKNDLARKALSYSSQVAEVMSSTPHETGQATVIVYRVKAEDGSVLQLSEDCLMHVK